MAGGVMTSDDLLKILKSYPAVAEAIDAMSQSDREQMLRQIDYSDALQRRDCGNRITVAVEQALKLTPAIEGCSA